MLALEFSDAVVLAAIAAFVSTIGPLIVAYIARKDRREQWARDDRNAAAIERVHGLVNSQMTQQIEQHLAVTVLNLALLKAAPIQDLEAMAVAESQITRLRAVLTARAEQARIAEAQGVAIAAAAADARKK